MYKLLTLARNTFLEIIRQRIYAVIIAVALLLFFISPSITMYTMSDDNKLLRELGLSTLFLSSLFIAVFAASGAVADEIENKTITTILSKPVPRTIFILAKFTGVAAAVTLAHYVCTVALLMAIRHGVLETASDTHDRTVLAAVAFIIGAVIVLTALFNYFYDWKFSSTAVVLTAIFATAAIVMLSFIDRTWRFNPSGNRINTMDVYGAVLLLLAALIIVALAVALSSRFNIMVTLSACIGMFLLGLISDYVFGRLADSYLWARIGRYLVPNLQVFWISDAIYEASRVPAKYIAIASVYTICYTAGILLLAVAVFQKRQVG